MASDFLVMALCNPTGSEMNFPTAVITGAIPTRGMTYPMPVSWTKADVTLKPIVATPTFAAMRLTHCRQSHGRL